MAKAKYGYLIRGHDIVHDNFKDCLESDESISPGDILEIYKLSYVDTFPVDVDSLMWQADETWGWYGTAALNCSYFTDLNSEEVNDFKVALDRVTKKHLGNNYYVKGEDLLGAVRLSIEDMDFYKKKQRLSTNTKRKILLIKNKVDNSNV
ncbi:hypothetical protein [Snodgrassella alvi]|uniref:hypothetical protein n=1 Tax=Snodgrassella alvi TaxID=1196083 RepID=UPI000C1E4A24|nr:hypothetical protein [Snodgrassella alvi]PIT43372.1 hypothetical protein BHC51_11095 [Snodgrassella alvi]